MRSDVVAVLSGACLTGLLWVFYGQYRKFRQDILRLHFLQARSTVLNAAERGAVPLDHPSYLMMQRTLLGLSKVVSEISLWIFLYLIVVHLKSDSAPMMVRFQRQYEHALRTLPEASRGVLRSVLVDAHIAMLSCMVHTSVVTFPLVMVFKFFYKAVAIVRALWLALCGAFTALNDIVRARGIVRLAHIRDLEPARRQIEAATIGSVVQMADGVVTRAFAPIDCSTYLAELGAASGRGGI